MARTGNDSLDREVTHADWFLAVYPKCSRNVLSEFMQLERRTWFAVAETVVYEILTSEDLEIEPSDQSNSGKNFFLVANEGSTAV